MDNDQYIYYFCFVQGFYNIYEGTIKIRMLILQIWLTTPPGVFISGHLPANMYHEIFIYTLKTVSSFDMRLTKINDSNNLIITILSLIFIKFCCLTRPWKWKPAKEYMDNQTVESVYRQCRRNGKLHEDRNICITGVFVQ